MIGLDSNILIRYLVQDDPNQAAKATRLIEHTLTEDNLGFVSVVTMAETAWVLERVYQFSSHDIAAAIERMIEADVLVVENEQEVLTATIALREGLGSFGDALIGALGARAGCTHTLTFDRKALRLTGFAPA